MPENQSITDVIQLRYSCRTFKGTPLKTEMVDLLNGFVSEIKSGPSGCRLRFRLISGAPENVNAMKGLGTYGVIKGASGFIVGAVENGPFNLEEYGYAMENIILYATQIGLGTCWLGGTFNKSVFAKKIAAGPDEIVPAVAAFGEIAEQSRIAEKIIRWGARASTRKPWHTLFFDRSFGTPLEPKEAGPYQTPLEMVRIGPSASNKQPWRIVRAAPYFHFYLQRTKGYFERNKKYFGMADMQRIDMGIAMCHFDRTCQSLSLKGKWMTKDPEIKNIPTNTTYVTSFKSQ